MLKTIICNINTNLEALDIADQVYDLAELHIDADSEGNQVEYPAIYQSSGNWEPVLDIDNFKSVIYHRGIAPFTEEKAPDNQQHKACDDAIQRVYKMKLVAFARKDALGSQNDNNYFEHRLANLLRETIRTENDATIGTTFGGVYFTGIIPNEFSVIQQDIIPSEVQGMPFPVLYEWGVVSINYNITIIGQASCFDACANEFE